MGKLKRVLASLSLASACLCHGMQPMNSTERSQLEREARLVVDLMQNYHESGRMFRELDNHEILTGFIEELDPSLDYLLKDDVEFIQMRFGRSLKTVYLLKGDLQPAFEIFELFEQRVKERSAWIKDRLTRGYTFEQDETFTQEKTPSATANGASANDRWEHRLQNEILTEMLRGRTEPDARATLATRYAKVQRQIATMDSLAVRERFFDGLLQTFDPHSGYFSADTTREFALEMSGSVGGAGFELKKENGLCLVANLQAGGPADLTTDLRPGDIIEAFAEGDAALTQTKGKRLREIVKLIRGKPGTQLKLAYRHASEDQKHECTLERANVVSIDDRARGAICDVSTASGKTRRIGWIDLPMFYASNDESAASSATKDVTELLTQMRKAGIDGVVMDLRNNGGGALTEALALSGLFIPKGLVMLTRGLDGKRIEHFATESAEPYTGPFVILTSERSASASEIFAGAMKFHHRALIVGSPATYGKGSVQNYIELTKTNRSQPDDAATWGTLRLTHERFFQPDGQPVQRKGITADIVLPQDKNPDFKREETLPHALPAVSLPAPDSAVPTTSIKNPITPALCDQLRQHTEDNVRKLPEWSLWQREEKFYDDLANNRSHTLQFSKRLTEYTEAENKMAALRSERRKLAGEIGYATETIEIASVKNAINAHRAHLASLLAGTNEASLNRIEHDAFIFKTEKGMLRRIWLDQFEFDRFFGDSEPLAAAYSTGSGQPMTAAQMRQILKTLALLEEHTEQNIFKCFAPPAPHETDLVATRKGLEAMLLRVTEIDAELLRHRPALDVQVRESLRIATAWADTLETPAVEKHP